MFTALHDLFNVSKKPVPITLKFGGKYAYLDMDHV